jgi:DNA-directed RNA polymerase
MLYTLLYILGNIFCDSSSIEKTTRNKNDRLDEKNTIVTAKCRTTIVRKTIVTANKFYVYMGQNAKVIQRMSVTIGGKEMFLLHVEESQFHI